MERFAPEVILVDRQPFGRDGELREGLERAGERGTSLVLGLPDVVGAPAPVAAEVAGASWIGVGDLFDSIVVYGERSMCDHLASYGLPIAPRYCGWVAEAAPARGRGEDDLLLVAVTEDPDDAAVAVTAAALGGQRGWRVLLMTDATGDAAPARRHRRPAGERTTVDVRHDGPPEVALFARAGAVVTVPSAPLTATALAAGCRTIVVRRRSPPSDHRARATRLVDLDLVDPVDDADLIDGLSRELDRRRRSPAAGRIHARPRVGGADRVAAELHHLAAAPTS